MIPEFTLALAAAFIVGATGVMLVINGIRWAFLDEVFVGAVLIVIAWGLTVL